MAPWKSKENGYHPLESDGKAEDEDDELESPRTPSTPTTSAINRYAKHQEQRQQSRPEAETTFLMLSLQHRFIRKFLHFVLFPNRLAKFCAGFVHIIMTEVYTVVQLTVELSRQMSALPGKKWVLMLLRLLVYAALLMPGFIQVGLFYFFSSRVRRSIPYGPNPRNRCDLYLPHGSGTCSGNRKQRGGGGTRGVGSSRSPSNNLPVTIFVTGGAWIIGYKAWGALFGKVLSKEGVIVVSLDYRNFPQGRIKEMLSDVDEGIGWVVNNIHKYGGDPTNICIVGQSAGAHLTSLALIECAEKAQLGEQPEALAWQPQQIRTFVGVSGAYDMVGLEKHLCTRGMHSRLLNAIMSVNGKPCLKDLSPAARIFNYVENPNKCKDVVASLPLVVLLHGKEDHTIPHEHAEKFSHILERAGVPVEMNLYEGETHTSPLIENPMRGTGDRLLEAVLQVIKPDTVSNVDTNNRRLVPEVLIRLALQVSPF
jgi:prenylcysteine alpha-carboxyl methylesterase